MARPDLGGLSDRGRDWQRLVAAWRRSGLTQAAFCRHQGVNVGTFCWWKRQLTLRHGAPPGIGGRRGHAPRREGRGQAPRTRARAPRTRVEVAPTRTARPSAAPGAKGSSKNKVDSCLRENAVNTARSSGDRNIYLLRTPKRRSGSAPAVFAPVHIRADEPSHVHVDRSCARLALDGRIEIVLDDGRRIRVNGRVDRQMLTDVLAVLDPGHATGGGTFHRGDDALRVRGEARAC